MSTLSPGIQPERIHLLRVFITKASIDASDAYLMNPQAPLNVNVGHQVALDMNPQDNFVRIRLLTTLEGLGKGNKPIGISGQYDIVCDYVVDNLKNHYTMQGKVPMLSEHMAATLMGIMYSTVRGIILERTAGTFFNGVLLQVIDPRKLLASLVPPAR